MGGVFGGGQPSYTPPPEPVEEDLSEENAREERLAMIRRRRRGRVGTVHTSWTGDKVDIPDELRQGQTSESEAASNIPKKATELQSTLGG